MNKRQIIASLNNIANELDFSGLYKEASSLTNVMKRLADESNLNPIFDPRQKDTRLDTFRAMGHARGGYLDFLKNEEEDIPSRQSPGNQLSQNNDESARIREFLSKTVSELTEDELPRWIKEKRDRAQNPPQPQVAHPSEVELKQMVEDIFPTFMEQYEQFWDQYDVELPAMMDPRIINEMTDHYLVIGKNDPVEFLKTERAVTSGEYKDWFQQNFDFLVDHMKFVEDFKKSQGIGVGIMVKMLQKARGH